MDNINFTKISEGTPIPSIENKNIPSKDQDISPSVKESLQELGKSTPVKKQIIARQTKKAGEAEDIQKSAGQILRPRRGSLSIVSSRTLLSEAEEVKNRSGELWDCVGRKPNKTGGYIYVFKIKEEFDDVTPHENRDKRAEAARAKKGEISPAIEFLASELFSPSRSIDEKELYTELYNLNKKSLESKMPILILFLDLDKLVRLNTEEQLILRQLGYVNWKDESGVYMELPDQQALLTRWEKLRETHHTLPKLDIVSSEGIADDMSFVEAYFTHDALLSTGKEFVHDHQAHLMVTIRLMLSADCKTRRNPSYQTERSRLVKALAKTYRRIMLAKTEIIKDPAANRSLADNMDKLQAALGAAVDLISSHFDYGVTLMFGDAFIENRLNDVWTTGSFAGSFMKRFGKENIDTLVLNGLWERVKEIEREFDMQRQSRI